MTPEAIKAIRKRHGFDLETFGQTLGVSLEIVQAWKQGLLEPEGMYRSVLEALTKGSQAARS